MAFSFRVRHDSRFTLKQHPPDLARRQADLFGIPGHVQHRKWSAAYGSSNLRLNAGYAGDNLGNIGVPGFPLTKVGLNVAFREPDLDRAQHAHDFFLTHLQGAPKGVMGRTVGPGRANQVSSADQQPGVLRPTNDFATTVRYQISAQGDVWIGNDQIICGGVHQYGNVLLAGDRSYILEIESRPPEITAEHYYHGRVRTDRRA